MQSSASVALLSVLLLGASCANPASAQNAPSPPSTPPDPEEIEDKPSGAPPPFAERLSTTSGKVTVGNQSLRYKAYAGTLPLKGEDGKADAEVFYVAYHKEPVKDLSKRPVTFVFNGGPGSSAVWLHLGTFGPRRVSFNDAVHPSPPPYNIVNNQYSILDETDLVFIDPVGTGYSRPVDDGKVETYSGVQEDIASVAEFIRLYVTRTGRWNSPKFLAGESYGTTRAAGLVAKLQQDGMFFNGLILISAVLDFRTMMTTANNDLAYALFFPTLAATAAYHESGQKPDSRAIRARVDQAKDFVRNHYVGALMQGFRLPKAKLDELAQLYSSLTGLSADFVKKHNLRIGPTLFRKELRRSKGYSLGRLDSRYLGLEASEGTHRPDHDPSFTAISGPYTAAMNHYLKHELKATVDHRYEVLNFRVNRAWNWSIEGPGGYVDVAGDLARAMRVNPYLQVYVANGYFDLATPFFATEYTVDHLAIPASVRVNLSMSYFDAGHMMYLHDASLRKLKDDLATLFARSRRAAATKFKLP